MNTDYDRQWLINKYWNGDDLKFLFFWGHNPKHNEEIGKYCFSQWFELPFLVDGVEYKTTEHWMMANKALLFDERALASQIINSVKPGEAKALGRQVRNFDELIWDQNKFEIVKKGNIHKFNQHPRYAEFLINTGNRILVEASPVDTIWGIGLDQQNESAQKPDEWRGENLLGFALMEVRDFLKGFGHFEYHKNNDLLPWKIEPKIDPADMFWRMGRGETIISNFSKYYDKLSQREREILKLSCPEPLAWKQFYR